MSSLLVGEFLVFLVLRSKQLKMPNTPRKRKMRAHIADIKTENKGVKREWQGWKER